MIVLHQFAPAFGLPNASPFCMKLETYLRLAGLPYRLANDGDVFKAPKGKLPWIEDGALQLADSGAIVDALEQRLARPVDAGLAPVERAQALAFRRLLEEDLYWAVVYTRWVPAEAWALTRQAFFGALPAPLRLLVPPLARRSLRAQLRGHGMGRHTPTEIMAIGCSDLDAVADFLADKPFLMGAQPRTVDASAYAFLANILWAPVDSALRRHARTRPTLEAYCQRMKARCFPDPGPEAHAAAA